LTETVKFFRISDTSLSLVADLGLNEEMLESDGKVCIAMYIIKIEFK
jgi:hypothetical protein